MTSTERFLALLKRGDESKPIELWFDEIADMLFNELCIQVGENRYRVVEIEFYYNDGNKHIDNYTHCAENQLTNGRWYFHRSGVDITFGNKNNKVYGGILIRGVQRLETNIVFVSGPVTLVKEIFMNTGDISKHIDIKITETEVKGIPRKYMKGSRIRLSESTEEGSEFTNKRYRYVTALVPEHKFPEKEKLVLENSKDEHVDIKSILGYMPKI